MVPCKLVNFNQIVSIITPARNRDQLPKLLRWVRAALLKLGESDAGADTIIVLGGQINES